MINKVISHYEILAKVGQGGMGVVYKARDTKLNRTVAIKFLPPQIAGHSEDRERFKIEAQAAAALNHPYIATIHAIEEFEDELFIVMEYIEGEELRDMVGVQNVEPLPMDKILTFATQIAEGLQAAHKKGIIHRDIKSTNIMITEAGHVKIMDFGLAKITGGLEFTKIGTTVGTAAYMSPEQTRGEVVDARTDIWSLGVVMYEMFTGQLPFKGEYEAAVIYGILHENPEPIRELRPDIPEAFERVLHRALQKDRNERYPDIAALQLDLEALSRGDQPNQDGNFSSKTAGSSPMWRRPGALSIGFGLLLAVVFLFYFMGHKKTNSPATTSVGVMAFEFQTPVGDWRWLEEAVTELLTVDLVQYPNLRVVGTRELMKYQQDTEHDGSVKLEGRLQLARAAHVENLIWGHLQKNGEHLTIRAQRLVTQQGRISADNIIVEGEISRLYDCIDEVSSKIQSQLHIAATKENPDRPVSTMTTPSLDALRYYIEGKDAAYDLRHQESIEKLSKAVSLDSTFITAYYFLAWQYSRIGDNTKAKEILAKGKPYISNASMLERLKYLAEEAKIENRWTDYAVYLDQLLQIRPSDAVVLYQYGWTKYQKFRDLGAGINAMQKALQLDSTFTYAYNDLGYAYLEKGDKEKAMQIMKHYVSLNPADVNPLDSMAEMQVVTGQYDQAIANCERILTLQPDFLYSRLHMALAYIAQAKYARAAEVIDAYLKIADNLYFQSLGYTLRARMLFVQNEFETAKEAVQQAIALDSTDVEARWLYGRILLKLDSKEALEQQVAALDRILLDQGGLDGRWYWYHLKGEVALQNKDFASAIDWYKKALELSPTDRSFYLTALADACEKSGQLNDALKYYRSALKFNPNNASANFGLGGTYEKLGKITEAKSAYRQVVAIWSQADQPMKELQIAKKKLSM